MRRHRDKRWREAEAARREAIRTRGKREERRQWTKGNNQSGQTRGNIGGEASANNRQRRLKSRRVWQEDKRRRWRRNEMRRDNQPGCERQMGRMAPADKRQHSLESQRRLETMRGRGCTARGQKKDAVHRKGERQRRRWSDKMRRDNQPGQSKGEREVDDPSTAKQKL